MNGIAEEVGATERAVIPGGNLIVAAGLARRTQFGAAVNTDIVARRHRTPTGEADPEAIPSGPVSKGLARIRKLASQLVRRRLTPLGTRIGRPSQDGAQRGGQTEESLAVRRTAKLALSTSWRHLLA